MGSDLTATIRREEATRHELSYLRMKRLNRWRLRASALAVALLVGLAPSPAPSWALAGTLMVLLGLGVRALAAATLVKIDTLTTHGIYTLSRNPLYLGNVLIALGLGALGGHWGWIAVFLGTFGLIYRQLILAEEAYLRQQYGAAFDTYCLAVPRFFPRLAPARLQGTLSAEAYRRNRELNNLGGVAFALAVLWLKVALLTPGTYWRS